MTCRTSNRLAAVCTVVLVCGLAGCSAPAPEPVPEPAPPAIPEPPPVDPFQSHPPATVSLPLAPVAPKPSAEGATAASKPEATQPLVSGSGPVQAPAPTSTGNQQPTTPKAGAGQPSASGSGALAPVPTVTGSPQPPPQKTGTVEPSVSGSRSVQALASGAAGNTPTPPKTGTAQPATATGSIQAPGPTVGGTASTQLVPIGDAVISAANALFAGADSVQLSPALSASGRFALTVDPPVDGTTGFRTVATRAMQTRLDKLVREQYARYEVKPFTTATLAAHPLLLIGTLTAVDKDGKAKGARDAVRVCLVLVDLQNGRVVSKGSARANPAGVDTTPTLFFADSPAWAPDAATQGYLKTCHEANPGDPVNPAYSSHLPAAALVSDAVTAYETGDYDQAYKLFNSLRRTPGGDQLRMHNGLYLASRKLGRRDDEIRAFAHLVNFGLAQKQLGIRFLFRPGSATFVEDPQVSSEYPLWLSVVSQVAERRSDCLEVSGHSSRTGAVEAPNERLSLMRAQYIKQRIDAAGETIGSRTRAVGNRDNLSGLGTDDAFDPRVEFRVLDCKAKPS